jgi:hypothetical protein
VVIELRDGRRLRGHLQLPDSESANSLLARAKPFLTIRTSSGDISFHRDTIAAVLMRDEGDGEMPLAPAASRTRTEAPAAKPEARRAQPSGFDPCRVLDVRPGASREELKAAWRRRIAECHPDRIAAQGAPADIVAAAQRQAATINAAYQQLSAMRRGS